MGIEARTPVYRGTIRENLLNQTYKTLFYYVWATSMCHLTELQLEWIPILRPYCSIPKLIILHTDREYGFRTSDLVSFVNVLRPDLTEHTDPG